MTSDNFSVLAGALKGMFVKKKDSNLVDNSDCTSKKSEELPPDEV